MSLKKILLIVLFIILFVYIILFFYEKTNSKEEKYYQNLPPIKSEFSLKSHDSETLNHKSFYGKYLLIYFGFTYCPDVCPTSLKRITETYDALPKKIQDQLKIIFITVDPERDTVPVMKNYVTYFHDKLIGLTGNLEEITKAAKSFGIYFKKSSTSNAPDAYLVDHSTIIYLMDTNGFYLNHFNHDIKVSELTKKTIESINKVKKTKN